MSRLASKNRPKRFASVVGQDNSVWMLRSLVRLCQSGNMFPAALLLTGSSGVGKTSLARVVARALNCEDTESDEPCLTCLSCQQSMTYGHPSIVEVDAANFAGAEEARELVSMVSVKHSFKYLTVIVDECHSMSRKAWDVFLRVIESCPDRVVFVFCTTSADSLRPEVLSRMYRFDLRSPTKSEIAALIRSSSESEGRAIPESLCYDIAYRARGNVRMAYQIMEKLFLYPDDLLESALGPTRFGLQLLESALRRDRIEGVKILDSAWEHLGSTSAIYADWAQALEDLLRFKLADIPGEAPEIMTRYRDIASGYHETMIAAGLEAITEWARRDSRRASLTFAWTAFLKAIGGPTVVDSAAVGAARKHARRATAADLSNFTI